MRRPAPCRTSDQPPPMLRPRLRHSRCTCRCVVDEFNRRRSLAAVRAFQATDNIRQGHLPSVRRGEVTKRQRSPGTALTSDAEPQMGEFGEAGRPWRLSRERWLGCRQWGRLLDNLAQPSGFGALAIASYELGWLIAPAANRSRAIVANVAASNSPSSRAATKTACATSFRVRLLPSKI